MANLKITELTALSAQPADGDLLPIVDVNDTTDSANGTTKKITYDTMIPDASATVYGKTKLSTAPASATAPIAVGDNDTRVPTQGENDALAGTSGTPSSTNKYVTNDDTAETGNSKVVRTTSGGVINNGVLPFTGDFNCGATTYDISTASGAQNIAHGLGAIPRYTKITAMFTSSISSSYSNSVYNGTTQVSLSQRRDDDGTDGLVSTSFVIYGDDSDSNKQTGVITTDSTNIIITWTKAGSPTGTANLIWEAFY